LQIPGVDQIIETARRSPLVKCVLINDFLEREEILLSDPFLGTLKLEKLEKQAQRRQPTKERSGYAEPRKVFLRRKSTDIA
jgi:hypothetical protein